MRHAAVVGGVSPGVGSCWWAEREALEGEALQTRLRLGARAGTVRTSCACLSHRNVDVHRVDRGRDRPLPGEIDARPGGDKPSSSRLG
jgi:hypothetical protein